MNLIYKDYPEKKIIEIEGAKYSYEVFKGIGKLLPLNTPLEITERKDGVITIQRLGPIKVTIGG